MDDEGLSYSDTEEPSKSNCPQKLSRLPMVWKILTALIREQIYYPLLC